MGLQKSLNAVISVLTYNIIIIINLKVTDSSDAYI